MCKCLVNIYVIYLRATAVVKICTTLCDFVDQYLEFESNVHVSRSHGAGVSCQICACHCAGMHIHAHIIQFYSAHITHLIKQSDQYLDFWVH